METENLTLEVFVKENFIKIIYLTITVISRIFNVIYIKKIKS